MKTKAVVFPEENKFELTEITLPDPGPEDIVVKTLVTAISPGTERWTLLGRHIGTVFPCIPGYQRIGIVQECGNRVTSFQVGDFIYGSAGSWKENIYSRFGAHVGLSVGNWKNYYFIGSGSLSRFELETLVFVKLIAVANKGIRFINPLAGQSLLIIGAGLIGIGAAQLAQVKKATPILLEKDPAKIEIAKKTIPNVLSPDDENLTKKLLEMAPAGFDFLYDTVGHAETTDRMVQLMRHSGIIMLQAQYFDKVKQALDLDQIKIKELVIRTACGTDAHDIYATINNIRSRQLSVAPLITHRLNDDNILRGYEMLLSNQPTNLGIVFHWDNGDELT